MSTGTVDPILPAFEFGGPNRSTHLADDYAVIEDTDGRSLCTGQANVQLDLLPTPRINAYVCVESHEPFSIVGRPAGLNLRSIGHPIPGFIGSLRFSTSTGTTSCVWCPTREPILSKGTESTPLSSVLFHIFNFKELAGSKRSILERGDCRYGIEHISLTALDWTCELQSLPETKQNFEALKDEGGYGLTHVGRFKKTDDSPFTPTEASEFLELLRFFLSFAKGVWCEPICPIGLDESNNQVWRCWSSPKGPFCSPLSWFDEHRPEQLQDLFPGFASLWLTEYWRSTLREVIYWYLNANDSSRGVDAGIILTQTALERLSFQYAVRERLLIEAGGFKDLRASDRLRLLLSSLDIPIAITPANADLQGQAKTLKWSDAPHALTEIRNSLVHPEHKRSGQFHPVFYGAWNLGLWLLELAILRLCGYSAKYADRLREGRWLGQVDEVPWTK